VSRYSDHDDYVDPVTGVLRNLLGITEPAQLELVEAEIVASRSFELSLVGVGDIFDAAKLKHIHLFPFRDLYEWAGRFRTVDISKGTNRFAHHAYLESAAMSIFIQLREEQNLAGLDMEAFGSRAAYYLGELNALHPFREGNGRTSREFLGLLARRNGFVFQWKMVNQTEMLQSVIDSFHGNLAGLTAILRRIVQVKPG